MDQIIKELEDLGKEISKAEKDVQTEEGKISAYMQTLETDFGLTSLVDAEAELNRLKEEKEYHDVQINEKFKTLKENYSW